MLADHHTSRTQGTDGAITVQTVLDHARAPASGVLGTIVGLAILLFSASGVFGELQDSLNVIWEVQPRAALTHRGARSSMPDGCLAVGTAGARGALGSRSRRLQLANRRPSPV